MKSIILNSFILAFGFCPYLANGSVYQVDLGRNASLQSGDVGIVQYGNYSSVISCGGGSNQPDHYDFTSSRTVNLSMDFQNRDEDNARVLCELPVDYVVTQTATSLLNAATNECLRSYSNCKQIGKTSYQYVPKHRNRGLHGCLVQVTVRGQ